MIRGARAAGRADPAVTAAREAPVRPPDPDEPRFDLPPIAKEDASWLGRMQSYGTGAIADPQRRWTPPRRLEVGERGVFNDMDNPVARNREEMQNFSDWFGRSIARRGDRPAVMYHGTLSDFDTFEIGDIGFHVGTQQQANRRVNFMRQENVLDFPVVDQQGNVVRPPRGTVMPVYAKAENPLLMPDVGEWRDPYEVHALLPPSVKKHLSRAFNEEAPREMQARMQAYSYDLNRYYGDPNTADEMEELRRAIRAAGHDSIAYENLAEGPGHSLILLDATQIKSASGNVGRFDPTVPAITAGVGAGAVGLGVMQRDPVEEDRESFRRALQERGL